jgi:hypothetical protein
VHRVGVTFVVGFFSVVYMGPRSFSSLTSVHEHVYKVTEELLLTYPYNEQVDKVWVFDTNPTLFS